MKNKMRSRLTTAALTMVLFLPFAASAQNGVQPREVPDSQKDQSFDHHSLSGIWWGHAARGTRNSLSATPPPMTQWAQQRHDAAKPGLGPRGQPLGNDPMMICDPMGYPRILFWNNYPYEIIQLPDRMIMFFDWFYTYRTIWTDGRALPSDPDPKWYGYSVGKWEGDVFVVQSNGFDDRTWLDADGHPHTDEMRLEERFHRTDHNTIELSMTLTDPKAYAKPWVSDKFTFKLADGKTEMREDVCVPSVEAKYKETIREPAGGAAVIKK
jgi:hypothetical protein